MFFQKLSLSCIKYVFVVGVLFSPFCTMANQKDFDLAMKLMSENKWQQAEKKLLALQKRSPNDIAILNNLGITSFHLNKREKARKLFIQAVESNPQTKIAFRNILLLNSNQTNKRAYFKTIVQTKNNSISPSNRVEPAVIKPVAQPLINTQTTNTRNDFRQAAEQLNNRPPETLILDDINDEEYGSLDSKANGYLSEIDKEIDMEIDLGSQDNLASSGSYLNDLFSKDTIIVDEQAPPKRPLQEVSIASPENEKEITARLSDWAKAWESGDVDTYFSYYAPNYSPTNQSRKSWMRNRRQRINPEKSIQITISEIRVSQINNPDKLITRFLQKYQAKSYRDSTYKELHWQKREGKWIIVREKSL